MLVAGSNFTDANHDESGNSVDGRTYMNKISCKKFILLTLLLSGTILFSAEKIQTQSDIFNIEIASQFRYVDLVHYANALAATYPDLIKCTEIGRTSGGRPIIEMTLSAEVQRNTLQDKVFIGIDAGIHGREYMVSSVLLETFESYCFDYKNKDADMRALLEKVAFKAILNVNPDGMEKSFSEPNWKANGRGVDINRNFAWDLLEYSTQTWRPIWEWDGLTKKSIYYSSGPSAMYYAGAYGDSEIETQIVKKFYSLNNIRSSVSMHTKGNLLFYGDKMLPSWYKTRNLKMAQEISRQTGLEISDSAQDYSLTLRDGSNGVSTAWIASTFAIPAFTLELTPKGNKYISPQRLYQNAYEKFRPIPLYLAKEALEVGYFKYKVYKNGQIYHDYPDLNYAQAVKTKIGGQLYVYEGRAVPESEIELKPYVPVNSGQKEPINLETMPYIDVKTGDFFYEALKRLYTFGVVEVPYDGQFRAQTPVTEEELLKMLIRTQGTEPDANGGMTAYYLEYPSTFGRKTILTREKAYYLTSRFLGLKGGLDAVTATAKNGQTSLIPTDITTGTYIYQEAIHNLYTNGFVVGDLRPFGILTRGETVVMVNRILE